MDVARRAGHSLMIDYTECLTLLMRDIVKRIPALSFIDLDDVLVFARHGRTNADGAFATCHCLTLPPSEPGYYFWRDRSTGLITRRSEWFVTKSPVVTVGERQLKYLVSFVLPRFCDQSFQRSRKERFYQGVDAAWIAKLDTVVHELYHIDPEHNGIRRIDRGDGTWSSHCHSPQFFREVADMVTRYLDGHPDPDVYAFLRHDFAGLKRRYASVVGTSFRTFPSYPQRFIERLEIQPASDADLAHVGVEPLRSSRQPTLYTEDDLHLREFRRDASRYVANRGQVRAA
jgi:hypothetical protein